MTDEHQKEFQDHLAGAKNVKITVSVPSGMRLLPLLLPSREGSMLGAVFTDGLFRFPQPTSIKDFMHLLDDIGRVILTNRWFVRRVIVLISLDYYENLHLRMGEDSAASLRLSSMPKEDTIMMDGPVPVVINIHHFREDLILFPGLPILVGHDEWPHYYKMSNETT